MLSKKKKVFVLVGMVALLVLTGVLNIVLNNNAAKANTDGGDVTYQNIFATYRADRTATRAETILYLDAIIANEASSEDSVANAIAKKEKIFSDMDLELTLESLIKACGFEDAFVTNSTENINIIVKQEVLTEVEANKILDVILRETTREATSVIIIPLK